MLHNFDRKLVLENGQEYYGYGFGDGRDRVVELVFNTSIVGYQEIISDPSYTDQGVIMTYPLIGNYGLCDEDYETETPTIGALIVREYNPEPSNWRATRSLEEVMLRFGIPGIEGLDTRKLGRTIRDNGCCRALICAAGMDTKEALSVIVSTPIPHNAVSRVSCKAPYDSHTDAPEFHVAAIDCGMKQNIVRSLNRHGCDVTVLPWNATAAEVEALRPDGVFISNGPGDPTDVKPVIGLVKALRGKLPIFGICLGHQIISLAYGGRTYKLKFGHRGGNHPVRNLLTGKIEMTSQNHSYAVDAESLAGTGLEVTHINLLDDTVEGAQSVRDKVFCVQYHPESAPGPQDSDYLFSRFIRLMEEHGKHAETSGH